MAQLSLEGEDIHLNTSCKMEDKFGINGVFNFVEKLNKESCRQLQTIAQEALQPVIKCNQEISLLSSIEFFNSLNELFNTDNKKFYRQCNSYGIKTNELLEKIKQVYVKFSKVFFNLQSSDLTVVKSLKEQELITILFGLYGYQFRGKGLLPKINGIAYYQDEQYLLVFDATGVLSTYRKDFFNQLSRLQNELGMVEKKDNGMIVVWLRAKYVPEIDVLATICLQRLLNG